jgi:type VI protein secretion system component Hcp
MQLSRQMHASAALPPAPEEKIPVPTKSVDGWTPELVRTCSGEEKLTGYDIKIYEADGENKLW